MSNLFFIHTPLQLMIAQMIIKQEKLKDNIMLYGYVDNNSHFIDIYDLTIVDELWKARVPMLHVSRWALMSRKHLLRDGRTAYHNYKFIAKVILDYHVDSLFLGDMWNNSCQLTAMIFHQKGFKICFYEEGCGHYIKPYDYGREGNLVDKVFAFFIDLLYYRPLYGVSFGYIHYWKGLTFDGLPMDKRYSVVPFYHESFDKIISVAPLISDKLNVYIEKEVRDVNSNDDILLLTSPCYINGVDDNPQPYIETIIDYVKSLSPKKIIHIKFHPRETFDVKDIIKKEFENNKICYKVIGEQVNIPVEYYLQRLAYNKVVMFITSTAYYNGYLFPKTEFVSLLEDYYNRCKAIGSINAQYIAPLLNEASWQ